MRHNHRKAVQRNVAVDTAAAGREGIQDEEEQDGGNGEDGEGGGHYLSDERERERRKRSTHTHTNNKRTGRTWTRTADQGRDGREAKEERKRLSV